MDTFLPRVPYGPSHEQVFTLEDHTRITAQYYPSCTEAQLVLQDAVHHTDQESAALAEHISADGVAQVFRPLCRFPYEESNAPAMAHALMQVLLKQNPTAPL